MKFVKSLSELGALYPAPKGASMSKVASHLTPEYHRWISASRFCALSTVGPEGTDCTPRGDDGPVVRVLDKTTLAMPDWAGNNRIDSLHNIIRDGRISLMFMVLGSANVVRVNGSAQVTIDGDMTGSFEIKGRHPRSVIIISLTEVYIQCARAIIRSGLWQDSGAPDDLPTVGEIVASMTKGEEGGPDYDRRWPERAKKSLW